MVLRGDDSVLGNSACVKTNFKYGVLIKSKQGTYVITPRNPEEFTAMVENARKNAVDLTSER